MSTQRKQYSAEFKARVALEALKGLKTVNELASTYGCIRRRLPIGNIVSKRSCPTFSRYAVTSGSATKRPSKHSSTNKSDNARWSWTG
jgi:hypothetical protein